MRSRIPLVLGGFLVIALIAVVGLAAFSPGGSTETVEAEPAVQLDMDLPISGRVASAVLALAVAPVRDANLSTAPAPASADTTSSTDRASGATTTTLAGDGSSTTMPLESSSVEETTAAPTTTAPATTTSTKPEAPSDTTPPAIQVLSPKDGATVSKRIVEFTGVTEHGAEVFSGPFDADTDEDGNWVINLVLAPGANGAAFTARDAAGNEKTVRIVVHYDPPTTTTKAPATTATKPPSTTKPPTTKPPTTKPPTTKPPTTTTTTKASSSGGNYSPQWPADAGGIRNVENWRSTVAQYWRADQVDCVLGIIKRESRGDPRAHNRSGASGLMQHLAKYWPSRAKGAGFVDGNGKVASPFNGAANIAAGKWLADYSEGRGKNWWAPWSRLPSYGSCGS